jgi:integration host factor subunit beta
MAENTYTKQDFFNELEGEYPEISRGVLEKIVNLIFDNIATALICGGRIEIRGFASMMVKRRSGKKVRNPKTNEELMVGDKGALYFRPSKELNKKINDEAVID